MPTTGRLVLRRPIGGCYGVVPIESGALSPVPCAGHNRSLAKGRLFAGIKLRQFGVLKKMSDIAERVKKIVVEHLGVDAEKVTEKASFIDDLGADSLDTVELVMAFEEEFGVEIPDDAAETILTVGDAVTFLEKNAA